MTVGQGQFGWLSMTLLVVAAGGLALFVRVEAKAVTPLIHLPLFHDRVLSASLVMSTLVATVMMATLVVGPFYLARALGLAPAGVGLTLSIGPFVAIVSGVPVGRMTDRFGAPRITLVGLVFMTIGTLFIAVLPTHFGVAGYLAPLVLTTMGYAMFQTANNTSVMAILRTAQRGVISGLLSLSRNLGLITGASVMGAVFAFASATREVTLAAPDAVATGMRVTFAVAGALVAIALTIAVKTDRRRQH
jgi:MFS family permease